MAQSTGSMEKCAKNDWFSWKIAFYKINFISVNFHPKNLKKLLELLLNIVYQCAKRLAEGEKSLSGKNFKVCIFLTFSWYISHKELLHCSDFWYQVKLINSEYISEYLLIITFPYIYIIIYICMCYEVLKVWIFESFENLWRWKWSC